MIAFHNKYLFFSLIKDNFFNITLFDKLLDLLCVCFYLQVLP